jgi:hypothetical protein
VFIEATGVSSKGLIVYSDGTTGVEVLGSNSGQNFKSEAGTGFTGNLYQGNTIGGALVYKVDASGNTTATSFNNLSLFAQTGVDADNIGIGMNALIGNVGTNTIGIGTNSLSNTSGGSNSVAIGYAAGEIQTGNDIVLVGYNAGKYNTGSSNVLLGSRTGENNTGGNAVLIGDQTGFNNTGNIVVALGGGAVLENTGISVAALGHSSLAYNRGNYIATVGSSAGINNTGNNTVAIGYNSLSYGSATGNTALGYNSNSTFKDDGTNLKNVASAATDINTSLNRITITAHGFGSVNEYINLRYTTTGTVIGGLSNNSVYQFKIIDVNTIEYILDLSSIGTDIHTFTPQFKYTNTTVLGANAEPTSSNQVMLGDTNVTKITAGNPTYTPTNDNDLTNKKYVDDGIAGIGGGGTWGSITGTLSSQTDLQNALDLKAPLISPSFTTPSLGVATATSINSIALSQDADLNVKVGTEAGLNLALGAAKNTFVGYRAGRSASGSTATDNVGFGHQTLYSNTTGIHNMALGGNALFSNTTGYDNTANGYSSLNNTTTGYQNTANGYASLNNSGFKETAGNFITGVSYTIISSGTTDFTLIGAANSTAGTIFIATGAGTGTGTAASNSNNNSALGYNSGRYTSSGSNLKAPYNSLFIGYDTRASADGNTNENVIGYAARGNGSNTVTIGNSSITDTYLQGDVTANTLQSTQTTGTAPFTVASTTKVTNLNADLLDGYTSGDFITSDGTGRTSPTEYSNLYGQAQADYTTDGAPATGNLVFITDTSPAEVITTATIAMDGWKMYNDQTADAATLTLSDCDPGESLTVYINRASAPTLAGTGLTFNQLPNTTAFAAATQMGIYFEVSYDGTTIDYYYYER